MKMLVMTAKPSIRLSFVLLLFVATSLSAQEKSLKALYKQPAGQQWDAALPIDNGRLAAMVYGNRWVGRENYWQGCSTATMLMN
jgi:alpha-L-fucosidase 2